jgi:hypothetical protein
VFRADALSDGTSGDRPKLPMVSTLRSQMYCASPKAPAKVPLEAEGLRAFFCGVKPPCAESFGKPVRATTQE